MGRGNGLFRSRCQPPAIAATIRIARVGAESRREVALALAVDVDVHERAHLARLVEDEVGNRERTQRVPDRRGVELEPALTAGLGGEQARQQDYGQGDASTERTGGRLVTACTASPWRSAYTSPLCAPT